MARQLAATTGETLTEAVKAALRERLERERRSSGPDVADRLVGIGRRCADQMRKPFHSSDHDQILYDEQGLPR